jgi:hypothetical protein
MPTTFWEATLLACGVRVGEHAKTFLPMRGRDRKRIAISRDPGKALKGAHEDAQAFRDAVSGLRSDEQGPFIVECDHPARERCGFADLRLDDDGAICEDVFPATLGGQALVSN